MTDALKALRSATHALHTELDTQLEIAAPGAGKREYLHYLQDLWGWMQPFEDQLWRAAWPQEIEAGSRGGKVAWIEADLRHAGFTTEQIRTLPLAGFRPDLATLAARFGVAYVIEGSQLGTKVLLHRLAPQLEAWTPKWLEGYGANNVKHWRAFLACTETSLTTPESRQEAAQAAAQAFASLAAWCAVRRAARISMPKPTPESTPQQ